MAMAAAAAAAAARAAYRTPASWAASFVRQRLLSSLAGEERKAADIINRAITLAKSSGGKKVVSSLLLTIGTTSLVHWAMSSLTAHPKNEADRILVKEDESNNLFQNEIEEELQQLESKLDSFLNEKERMLATWRVLNDKQLSVVKRSDTAYNLVVKNWEAEWRSTMKKAFAIDNCYKDFEPPPGACSVCGHPRTDAPGTQKMATQSPARAEVQSP